MQRLEYPAGHELHAAFWCDGEFYAITKQRRAQYGDIGDSQIVGSSGFVSEVYPNHRRGWLALPFVFIHPKYEGPCVYLFSPLKQKNVEAVHLKTGERFVASKDAPPMIDPYQFRYDLEDDEDVSQPEGETVHLSDYYKWLEKRLALLACRWYGECAFKRVVCDDAVVAMTGSEAIGTSTVLMGPTAAEPVLATPGLKTGHVVMYRRGGSARVMKLGAKCNPVHLVLAPDGLTFMAASNFGGAAIIDVDI